MCPMSDSNTAGDSRGYNCDENPGPDIAISLRRSPRIDGELCLYKGVKGGALRCCRTLVDASSRAPSFFTDLGHFTLLLVLNCR
ncbi:hypothetical protein Caka_2489 [Coraliomargarita akajimensis DSM 45221]|uniref:Uncharacterized protein n=1 Tax=Coraliomargarita akajimensis (strain DSM 45221 / IAM 15411 / JCM 23193 / KCTC 12865 / 04OKA010-24) TaxID=583355 RepID=D5ENM9_CORAD|nr:hypothetical protein Caka_2489 [Coraliomargarita akajimensis DSM 45221]